MNLHKYHILRNRQRIDITYLQLISYRNGGTGRTRLKKLLGVFRTTIVTGH